MSTVTSPEVLRGDPFPSLQPEMPSWGLVQAAELGGHGGLADALLAMFYNGSGRYELALGSAESAYEVLADLGFSMLILPELIEAATRCGMQERARAALRELLEATKSSTTRWAIGIGARAQALVGGDEVAESYFYKSIDWLSGPRLEMELARTRLQYGEWLRRLNRRKDAREQLRAAFDMFVEMGASTFSERARRELLATGEVVRKRTDDARYQLTPQEAQIVSLVGEGHTNPEIGARLYLSHRTVEWHLRKVYQKLGVNSRKELRRMSQDRLCLTASV